MYVFIKIKKTSEINTYRNINLLNQDPKILEFNSLGKKKTWNLRS